MSLDKTMARYHEPLDHGLIRAVVLLAGLALVGLVMWDPQVFAERIGGFNAVRALGLIWSVCAAMVYGVGFKPIRWWWQILFSPYISLIWLSFFWLAYGL